VFQKRGLWQFYQPLQSGGVKQRSCETTDKALARRMAKLVLDLAADHRWAVLNTLGTTVAGRKVTVPILYALSQSDPALQDFEASLGSSGLRAHVTGWTADILAGGKTALTASVYRRRLEHFLQHVGPAPTTADLSPPKVKAWLARLTEKGIAGRPLTSATRRSAFYALKSFVRYLRELGVLTSDPLAELKAPKKGPPRVRYESEATDRRIADAAPTQALKALFAFVHGTGAEVSPALEAVGRDFDLDAGICTVRGTKTHKRHRHFVRIEPWSLEILRGYLRAFLPNAKPWAGMTRHMAHHHHQATCAAIGVEDYTLRDARHSWAVRARTIRGESWEEIADQLGNSPWVVAHTYAVFKRPTQMQPPAAAAHP
jgi:integrase